MLKRMAEKKVFTSGTDFVKDTFAQLNSTLKDFYN